MAVVSIDISDVTPLPTCCNSPTIYSQYRYKLFRWATSVANADLVQSSNLRRLGYTKDSVEKAKAFNYLKFLVGWLLEIKYKQLNQSFCETVELPYTDFIKDVEVKAVIQYFNCLGLDVTCAFGIMNILVKTCCDIEELPVNCNCEDIVPQNLPKVTYILDRNLGDQTTTIEEDVVFTCCSGSRELTLSSITIPSTLTGITFDNVPSSTIDGTYTTQLSFTALDAIVANYQDVLLTFTACDTTFTKVVSIKVIDTCVNTYPNDFPLIMETLDIATQDGVILPYPLSAVFECCNTDNKVEFLGLQSAIPTNLGLTLLSPVIGDTSVDVFPDLAFQFNSENAVVGANTTLYANFKLCDSKIIKQPLKFNIIDSCVIFVPDSQTETVELNTAEILATGNPIATGTFTFPIDFECCDILNQSWVVTAISYGGYTQAQLKAIYGLEIINPTIGAPGTSVLNVNYLFDATIAPTISGTIPIVITLEFCGKQTYSTVTPVFSIIQCIQSVPGVPFGFIGDPPIKTNEPIILEDIAVTQTVTIDLGDLFCCSLDSTYQFRAITTEKLYGDEANKYNLTSTGISPLVVTPLTGNSISYDIIYSALSPIYSNTIYIETTFLICGILYTVVQPVVIQVPILDCATNLTSGTGSGTPTALRGNIRRSYHGLGVDNGLVVMAYEALGARDAFALSAKQYTALVSDLTLVKTVAEDVPNSTKLIRDYYKAQTLNSVTITDASNISDGDGFVKIRDTVNVNTSVVGDSVGFVGGPGILMCSAADLANLETVDIVNETNSDPSSTQFITQLLCSDPATGFPVAEDMTGLSIASPSGTTNRININYTFYFDVYAIKNDGGAAGRVTFDFKCLGSRYYHIYAASVSNIAGSMSTTGIGRDYTAATGGYINNATPIGATTLNSSVMVDNTNDYAKIPVTSIGECTLSLKAEEDDVIVIIVTSINAALGSANRSAGDYTIDNFTLTSPY